MGLYKFREQIQQLLNNVEQLEMGKEGVKIKIRAVAIIESISRQSEILLAEQAPETEQMEDAILLYNAALEDLQAIIRQREEISSQLSGFKLTPGRKKVLDSVVESAGAETIAATSELDLQKNWVTISQSANLNGGVIFALARVGVLDANDGLTYIGAKLMRIIAQESLASQKISRG